MFARLSAKKQGTKDLIKTINSSTVCLSISRPEDVGSRLSEQRYAHLLLDMANIPNTSLRKKVLVILIKSNGRSFTVQEFMDALSQDGCHTHQPTINRIVTILWRKGLVTKFTKSRWERTLGKGRPVVSYSLMSHLSPTFMRYTDELLQQLQLLKQLVENLANQENQKSLEQFEAELETTKSVMDEIQSLSAKSKPLTIAL